MPDYRIVCVSFEDSHHHITSVGTGSDVKHLRQILPVASVRSLIDQGSTFHTISPSTGKRAEVRKVVCDVRGCKVPTIRSARDAISDNNLDNMATCSSN